jgi:hypothetical protein
LGFDVTYRIKTTNPPAGATRLVGAVKLTTFGIGEDGKTYAAFPGKFEKAENTGLTWTNPQIKKADTPVSQYTTDNAPLQNPNVDHVRFTLKGNADAYVVFVMRYEFTHGVVGAADSDKIRNNAPVGAADYKKALALMGDTAIGTIWYTYEYFNLDKAQNLGWKAKQIAEALGKEGKRFNSIDIAGEMRKMKSAKKTALEYFEFIPFQGGSQKTNTRRLMHFPPK